MTPRISLAAICACLALASSSELWAQTAPQAPRTQVRFGGPSGMQIRWFTRLPDGKEGFSETPIEVPGRFNFRQGGTYRLKLSHIPGFVGVNLYPTLEVPAAFSREAQDFLTHNSVALDLRAEDFQDAMDGKLVTKTIFLPSADGERRGLPLLILRMGNQDMEIVGGAKKVE
jgi:hypothetical protein